MMKSMNTRKGLFGAPMAADVATAGTASSSPAAAQLAPSTAQPFKPQRNFLDKLGLVADAFRNNTFNADQLAARDAQEYQRYMMQQRQYEPQHVGNSIVRMNPQTGQYEAIYNAPTSASQGTALQQNYEYLKTVRPDLADSYLTSQTTAPPIVQANPDGTKTIYPAGQVPRAAAPQRQVIQQLPPGAKRMGGAPSAGGVTFP